MLQDIHQAAESHKLAAKRWLLKWKLIMHDKYAAPCPTAERLGNVAWAVPVTEGKILIEGLSEVEAESLEYFRL